MLDIEQATLDVSDISTETAIVHSLPTMGSHCFPVPSFRYATTASLTIDDIATGPMMTVITATAPISGHMLTASREIFAESIAKMKQAAADAGNDGFLLGYDCLNPEERIASSELGFTDDSVFVWGRAPGAPSLFDWCDVAETSFHENTVMIFLINGSTVSIHANIDWWNLLS